MSMGIAEITSLYWDIVAATPGYKAPTLPSKMPTPDDISRVETALSVTFPASVHYFVLHSPYGLERFTSDFSHPRSIVWINKEFHKNDEGYLPPFLLMWNNGHDGDCEGFDTRSANAEGEYPLIYWDYGTMTEADIQAIEPIARSFPEWLLVQAEHLLRYVR